MKKHWEGKWIYIDFLMESKSGKTNIYQVISNGVNLGDIKWYAPWRSYAFYPAENTLYEQDCLRDIANFLGEIKNERILRRL